MHRTGLWRLGLALLVLTSCSVDEGRTGGRAGDTVDGGGVTDSDVFTISASVSDSGEVTGYLAVRNPPEYTPAYVITGPVTCLNVAGNRATIGGLLERLEADDVPDPTVYRGWLFYVEDNAGRPDRISYEYIYEAPVTKCPTPTSRLTRFVMSQGDIVVIEGRR